MPIATWPQITGITQRRDVETYSGAGSVTGSLPRLPAGSGRPPLPCRRRRAPAGLSKIVDSSAHHDVQNYPPSGTPGTRYGDMTGLCADRSPNAVNKLHCLRMREVLTGLAPQPHPAEDRAGGTRDPHGVRPPPGDLRGWRDPEADHLVRRSSNHRLLPHRGWRRSGSRARARRRPGHRLRDQGRYPRQQ